jgi:hypothetical protein
VAPGCVPRARESKGVRLRLVAILIAIGLAAGLANASPADAHRSPKLGLGHEIDHLIWDTNALRREAGKPAFAVDFAHRELTDEEALIAVYSFWAARFDRALKRSYWWQLCLCESGGNWTMRNEYHGGLSFHPLTWAAYRPKGIPKYAYLATPGEQLRVARKVLADQGWDAWPACSRRLGLR